MATGYFSMVAWHRHKGAGLWLRLGGLILIGLAWLAISHDYSLVHAAPPHNGTVVECLLSAVAFLCASSGSSLLIVGPHLFDKIEIAEQWKRR